MIKNFNLIFFMKIKKNFLKNYFFKVQIQPIMLHLIGLIIGILSYLYFNIIFFILFFLTQLISLIFYKKINLKIFSLILITLSGFLIGFTRTFLVNKKYNDTIDKILNKNITIYGLIYLKQENKTDQYFKNQILIKIDKILIKKDNNKDFIKTNYIIKINLPNLNLENITSGKYIKLKNIKINKKNRYSDFFISQNCLINLFLNKIDYKIINQNNSYIKNISLKIIILRQNLLNKLNNKLKGITKTLFNYIFLGIQENNNDANQLKNYTTYWGINHYLARSGLHLVLIIFIWTIILKILPLKYIFKKIILIFLISAYVFLTVKSIAFNRAFLTIMIYNLCDLRKISINNIHVISLVCLITLIINPYKITLLDFQLSFILTFAICIIQELKFQAKRITNNTNFINI